MCSFTRKYIFWIQFVCVVLISNLSAEFFWAGFTNTSRQSTETQAGNNNMCQPSAISVNISTDAKIGFQLSEAIVCNNSIGNTNLYFYMEISFDESRFFKTGKFVSSGIVFFTLTVIREIKYVRDWKTQLHIYEDKTKSIRLATIPLHITTIEMNDPPSILPSLTSFEIPESIPTGSIIKVFTVSDPDTGEEGQLGNVYSDDIPDELEISKIVNNSVQLKTRKDLDAEKYINYSKTGGLNVVKGSRGPILQFSLKVEDKPGLVSTSSVNLTIIDVGDVNPACINHEITVNVTLHNTAVKSWITSLQGNCYGRNYVNNTVSYSLIHDTCYGLNITPSGLVFVANVIDDQFSFCFLLVQAIDDTFTNLTTDLTLQIKIISCPAETDYRGNHWEKGSPGSKTTKKCPQGYTGTVTRYCDTDGQYSYPVYNCTSAPIADLDKKISEDVDVDVVEVLDELAYRTSSSTGNSTLLIGDMDTVNRILSKVTERIVANMSEVDSLADTFMETVNNIIDEDTSQTWAAMIDETGSGADSVIRNIDSFVETIMTNKNASVHLRKPNIYLQTEAISACDKNVRFPSRATYQLPSWANDRFDQLVASCNEKVQSFSGVMYRNLSKILPSRTATNRSAATEINAPVMSFTFYPVLPIQPDIQVEITFQLYDTNWSNASCSFWVTPNSSNGYWSDKGCRRKQNDLQTDTVTCVCDHLTNFAVLMSPSDVTSVGADHITTLSIISLVGCIISMLCLFLNFVVHFYFWRFVRSVRSTLNMNLSCTLFLAYALFLAGVERTNNKVLCSAIAVLLHLLYLIVFLIMLAGGLHLAYSVLVPFRTRKPGVPLLIASYAIAVVIVAVSMGVVKMKGYGNENSCWLSTESGLIWAFIAPVLVIILINIVVIFVVIWKMCSTTAMSRKSNAEKTRTAARSVFILMPLLGVTWVFGVFSVNKDALVFQYLFSVFNSLQGALIFYCHCVKNKKIREAFRRKKSTLLSYISTGSSEVQTNKKSEDSSAKCQTSTF